jgi:hypothetical protein
MLAQKQQACHPGACLLPLSRHVCGGAMKTCLLKSSKHATPTHACCLEQACLWRRNENMLAQKQQACHPDVSHPDVSQAMLCHASLARL